MSRVAKNPVKVPSSVNVALQGQDITIKGPKGELSLVIHSDVNIASEDDVIKFSPRVQTQSANALAGTMRSLVNNMVEGVSNGFTKTLELVGVGYRAAVKGSVVNLSLGFSHPIDYQLPQEVTAQTPSNTTIVLTSSNKQQLGQVAAEIRAFRPPEPYKGKGVRYADERIVRKETKKK